MTAMENATRELMGIIADNQLAVAPVNKDASPEYWEQRGKWEGLEIAYGIVKKWMDDNAELLKEQEAVKPKSKVRHGANAQIQHFCGNCNKMLYGKPKFCSGCGMAVKWDGNI